MNCTKCGIGNPDDAQFCISCGAALKPGAQNTMMPKTSGMAIASMILGILSVLTCMLTALPAIILGIVSLIRISGSSRRLKGSGFAIAGIAIPIVLLPVIMAMLMPALARTRQIAFRMVCGTNLAGISSAMQMYVNENDGYPTPDEWCDLLIEECNLTPRSFSCPGKNSGQSNYALNKNIYDFGTGNDADIVMIFETQPGWNQVGGPEILTTENHNGDGCNVVFLDGHLEFVPAENIDQLKWKPDNLIEMKPGGIILNE